MIKISEMTNLNIPLLLTIQKWILDNGGQAYMQFKIDERCRLPAEFLNQPVITLNVTPSAVEDLMIDENGVSFRARFNGMEHHLYFPLDTIFGLYGGKDFEFSIGFPFFNMKFKDAQETPEPQTTLPPPVKKVPHLVRIK